MVESGSGYSRLAGREIWYVECMMGEVGPSPAYDNGIVYAVNQFWMLAAVDVTTRQIIWEAYDDLPEAGSPVASAGLVFLPTTYGVFSCLDGKTGEVYWVHEFKEGSYASPIRAGDKIYWTDRSGITHIFKAEKEFTLIGEPELGEQCQTTAAFVGERIYIRGQKHLFCIGNPEK